MRKMLHATVLRVIFVLSKFSIFQIFVSTDVLVEIGAMSRHDIGVPVVYIGGRAH